MTACFDGHVQGVGFRYTTALLAEELSVRGFVRNEMDGSVTVVAEGPEDILLALVCRLRSSHLGRYIRNESLSWSCPTGEFGDFSVRYRA
jgi:acylphosphatase